MEELIDFEELIYLNLPSVSQTSSEDPITDELDKMCEAMDESKIAMDNILTNNQNENNEIAPDDYIVNLDEFDDLLTTASLCNDESNSITHDILEINENDIVNIADEDTINLDEFGSISARACIFIDDEVITDNSNNNISNLHKLLTYEVPVEFKENACSHKAECDVIKKENITSTNKHVLRTISVESTVTSDLKENCIDLEPFEFDTLNPVTNNLKPINHYANGLETGTTNFEIETNIIEDRVTLTMNYDNEVKYTGETPVTDRKNTIETVTKEINTDSDDDFDPLDFEFITEEEASKAGLFTRTTRVINETTKNTENAENKLQNRPMQQNNDGTGRSKCNNSNNDDRPRKNEASWSEYVKYSKYRYQRCYSHPASQHRVIPEGERYLDMFRGIYSPVVVNNLNSLAKKRVLPAVAMAANFGYPGPGPIDEENEKHKGDADDCLEKILSTYPRENRRKRRRH